MRAGQLGPVLGGNEAPCPLQVCTQSLSRVRLCDPVDCSPPGSSSMGFSRQEDWSGLPPPPCRQLLPLVSHLQRPRRVPQAPHVKQGSQAASQGSPSGPLPLVSPNDAEALAARTHDRHHRVWPRAATSARQGWDPCWGLSLPIQLAIGHVQPRDTLREPGTPLMPLGASPLLSGREGPHLEA